MKIIFINYLSLEGPTKCVAVAFMRD